MRPAWIVLASLSLLPLPTLAAANSAHDGCGESDARIVFLDVWATECAGAVFSQPPCFGMTRHEHVGDAHVLVLSGWGCETGAIVELAP